MAFVYLFRGRGRGNTEKNYALQQWTVGCSSHQETKSCLMTKTGSRLQIWTSWCIPVSTMKDRKYLTCPAFGEQEKIWFYDSIWRSSITLLHLLIILLNSGLFPFFSLIFPWAMWYCLQSSRKIKRPFSQLLNTAHCLWEWWTHQHSWVLLYITQHMQR